MDGWDNFFVAMAGASVAFAGLVLVSISINLDRILQQPGLIGRAAEPLIVLFSLFVAASIILIPGQRLTFYGYELLVLGVVFSAFIGHLLRSQAHASIDAARQGMAPPHSFRVRVLLCLIIALTLLAAGASLALGREHGTYFLVPAMVFGFFLAFMEAWVLLIEIDR